MMGLCPECAHILYGYPNCDHHFQDGRCVNCYCCLLYTSIQLSEYIKLMPLEIAVFRNDVPMIHFLLEHGAD